MSGLGTLTVFVLGMRHGADPDHLAAIDNVTRNSHAHKPRLSRFTGFFFAAGHSMMVLSLAVFFSSLTVAVAGRAWLEALGTWLSIAILLLIAALNVRALLRNEPRPSGPKARLLPRLLREARNPLVALPIGLLFGLGFETSSQLAAYGVALSHGGGFLTGALVGVAFCGGLVLTDVLDGFLVHHIVAHRSNGLPFVARLWLWIVTVFAVAVAGYEIAPYFGFHADERSDLVFGLSLVAVLVLTFVAVFVGLALHRRRCDVSS
jgi:nickel/cobalt transporter (NiCoT) family protein